MDLWIRSQDKTRFIKCVGLEIQVNKQNQEFDLVLKGNGSSYIMAKYKTLNRALDVIDEIQNATHVSYGFTYANYKEINIVYEMPEE